MGRQFNKLTTVWAHVDTEAVDAHNIEVQIKLLIGQDGHKGVLGCAHIRIREVIGTQVSIIKSDRTFRKRLKSERGFSIAHTKEVII